MTKFYSIGLDNEFEEHDTLTEAEREANGYLDSARNVAKFDGWPELVESIQYGVLVPIGKVKEVDQRRVDVDNPDDGHWVACGVDEICDYKLLPVATGDDGEREYDWEEGIAP